MQLRRLNPHHGKYVAMLILTIAIGLLGCDNNADNVTPQDIENRTFFFDSSFIDIDLVGLTTCLEYGSESTTDENRLPFILKFQDAVNATRCSDKTTRCSDQAITAVTTFSGPAIVSSIEHSIEAILDEGGNMVDSIVLFDDVEFAVGEIIEFDVNVDEDDDRPLELTFTNDNGDELLFEFEKDETCADATPLRQ